MSISRETFRELAGATGGPRLSIYLPTHRRGPEIEQDPVRLKNLLAEARRLLDDQSVDRREVSAGLEAMEALIPEITFWRHQGEGLALFGDADGMRAFRLAAPVEELALVGDSWCVRPLLPAVEDGARYFLLVLSRHTVRLLECGRGGAREMDAHDVPTSLAEALGYDWEQESLQFHTRAQTTGDGTSMRAAIFHGQGRGSDERKTELARFFQLVDDALLRLLPDRHAPLVIGAPVYEIAMYRSVSAHPNILEKGLEGNVERLSPAELHEASLPIAQPALDATSSARRERLAELMHTNRVVRGVEKVVPECELARVDTLFVRPESPVWGRFDRQSRTAAAHSGERQPGDEDLLDLAIRRAEATGANIVCVTPKDLDPGEQAAAVLRY